MVEWLERLGLGQLFVSPAVIVKGYLFSNQGWLVGCFGFNGPLRQYFRLYRAVSQ